jgi:hypothetical protein
MEIKNSLENLKNWGEILIKKLVRYSSYVLLGVILEETLKIFSVIDFLNVDNIPGIDIYEFSLITLITLVCCFIIFTAIRQPNILYLQIKKNLFILQTFGLCGEIVAIYKSFGTVTYLVLVNSLIWFYLLDYISLKFVNYSSREEKCDNALYSEKPISTTVTMTSSQKMAFDQLLNTVDNASNDDSFNIGLIGALGSGKSTVLCSLMKILDSRTDGHKYFVLKISALEIQNVSNIIKYMKGFFEELFAKYEVSVFNKAGLLSAIDVMFDVKQPVKITTSIKNVDSFVNIEHERIVFKRQIDRLLEISRRKNIIIIVEDADRTDIKDDVLNLLYEFSEIDGIIGIISLDISNDIKIRPSIQKIERRGDESMGLSLLQPQYNELDKFIHVRIRIAEDKNISKEKGITQLILEQYLRLNNTNNKAFIQIPQKYQKISIFDINVGSTVIKGSIEKNDYDVLTEIFFKKLQNSGMSMGDYFESLATNYLYNTSELLSRVCEMVNAEKSGHTDSTLQSFYATYIDPQFYEFFHLDWLDKIESIANTTWTYVKFIYEGALYLERLREDGIYIKTESLGDIYLYYLNKDNTNYIRNSKMGDNIVNQYVYLVFDNEELQKEQICIINGDYKSLSQLVFLGMKRILKLLLEVIPLRKFIEYLRQSENNYRFLKMQLREAELLKLNYLDYLIGEWQIYGQEYDDIKMRLNENHIFEESDFQWISIRTSIGEILYTKYIFPYLASVQTKEINTTRAYIYNDRYICISEKDLADPICVSIDDEKVVTLNASEYEELKKFDDDLWGRKKE